MNHGQPRRAPCTKLDCALSGPGPRARENPVEHYVETQGAAEPPHPRDGQATLFAQSQPGEAGPVRSPCPQTLPAAATERPYPPQQQPRPRGHHPLLATFPALDRHQARISHPRPGLLDKFPLRWFMLLEAQCRLGESIMGGAAWALPTLSLMRVRCQHIPVAPDTPPPCPGTLAHTAWLPLPCSSSDMNAAFMQ